ncbi:RBP11-like subunits of RNA polymerase [Coccomyxa subellipsoidea C-169]|uniref:DNA-directed RNA polymerases I and III subunit RPAC2 n=1 Tax=Coccomyxa subellipsoidea (strain C-169) TaxID=574566 RepID=I0YUK2_COCSC|nr:RBP11-like subunits of RNA polymerase [Coccomyxa subellipsoidea C-169]EIE22071.1 RBP11-like subunits of RNA polymerase [Coccomyxa subellipsoidea C-169]|eukprot:XP_005646615.1 RBP11-like subunits of RNA polymerase [Coccomyxa subellipsoidea C-169]
MTVATGADTGVTFALEDEDHTLANSLRHLLNRNPHVSFVGYSIPHPSEKVVNLRIQTTGEISAVEALRQACQSLKQVCEHIKATFQEEYREHVESTGLADAAMAD